VSKRKCEDCGLRVEICRELGGCQNAAEADRRAAMRALVKPGGYTVFEMHAHEIGESCTKGCQTEAAP